MFIKLIAGKRSALNQRWADPISPNRMGKLAHWLLIIGGLNWLLVGIFSKDLFTFLGMDMTDLLPRIVYILVGLSALVMLKPKSSGMSM